MKALIKYLKLSTIPILIIITFLFFQAMCDLTLPEYTAKIVNVGIEQGGIEEKIPQVISESSLSDISLFLTDEEKITLMKNYQETTEYYTLSEKEIIYELKETYDEEEIFNLISKPITTIVFLNSESEEATELKNNLITRIPNLDNSLSLLEIIKFLPETERDVLTSGINDKLNAANSLILEQTVRTFIKSEYQKIGINTENLQINYILISGLKMLGIALISLILSVSVGFLGSRVAAKLARFLRSAIYEKVMSFSSAEFNKFSTASLITRTTNDVTQVQSLIVMMLRMIIYAPIMGIGGVIKVTNTNTSMTWIIVLAISIIIFVMGALFIFVIPKFDKVQKLLDKLNLVMREILSGIPVIRAFTREHHEEKRFDKANYNLTKLSLFVDRIMSGMMPLMTLIMNGIVILIIWVSAGKIDMGTLQVGDMMALIQYIMQIIMSFLMIAMASIVLPRAIVSLKRIDEVLTTKPVILDPVKEVDFTPSENAIVFNNVSFKYPDASKEILKNINFVAKKGETTAFIGSTGSGKSTIINLILRFFDTTSGSILIDGVEIRNMKQETLRSKIGYVPQKGVLFSGTIASNLKLGNTKATNNDLYEALEISQAKDFVLEKEGQLKANIAQGGTNVSGGQKQRLSIARALVKNPDILIFDDSFSALDFKTDKLLRSALKEKTKGFTTLIVAQRISTIMNAEQIIVLDKGEIVGIGTHKELLKNCKVYKEIALSQLGKDEL